ncbi:MAG: MerC domain-containing protein [Verrucomicrobiota bacterium]|nr:MerC domain-containing protein [Verrucomicrobiota bacterium]
MKNTVARTSRRHGWLDHLAIGMATVCAIHCLLAPILIMALPIIATTFIVHQDFHRWMIFLVLPTTAVAIFMGCRNHKDSLVVALSSIGLSVLLFALINERIHYASMKGNSDSSEVCEVCAPDINGDSMPMRASVWLNAVGGLFIASAHIRNFRLCRKSSCCHGDD